MPTKCSIISHTNSRHVCQTVNCGSMLCYREKFECFDVSFLVRYSGGALDEEEVEAEAVVADLRSPSEVLRLAQQFPDGASNVSCYYDSQNPERASLFASGYVRTLASLIATCLFFFSVALVALCCFPLACLLTYNTYKFEAKQQAIEHYKQITENEEEVTLTL